jgi:NADPH:quinone reductase-like Zn-dependent oxidoreductase
MSVPSTTSQWIVESFNGSDGLSLQHDIPLRELGPHDIVLKVYAVSLNSRDNQIANVSTVPKIQDIEPLIIY